MKLALPKGRLLPRTKLLLERAGLGFEGYVDGARHYRIESSRSSELQAKIFQERDVPIQVAIGNYDLGICGCQWIEELLAGYPLSGLVKVVDLGYGTGSVCGAVSRFGECRSVRDLQQHEGMLRIVSEYPNLAESIALRLRLRRFKVFPLWGSAEAYPPENSDIAVMWQNPGDNLWPHGLISIAEVLHGGACLVANRTSWESLNMGEVVGRLCESVRPVEEDGAPQPKGILRPEPVMNVREFVWLALPDGHQQSHAYKFLEKVGIQVEGYSSKAASRYPGINLPGVKVKIVRPQDMPMHVANGNFDLAITGKDWLSDHKIRFPSSPVEEVLDLGFGRVRIVAAMDGGEKVGDVVQLKGWMAAKRRALRIASEYTNIADKFAREHHLIPYKVIPTWGATEAFIPEDADVLIENTETGRTLAEHNLHIVDTLGVSSACVVANSNSLKGAGKKDGVAAVIDVLKRGIG